MFPSSFLNFPHIFSEALVLLIALCPWLHTWLWAWAFPVQHATSPLSSFPTQIIYPNQTVCAFSLSTVFDIAKHKHNHPLTAIVSLICHCLPRCYPVSLFAITAFCIGLWRSYSASNECLFHVTATQLAAQFLPFSLFVFTFSVCGHCSLLSALSSYQDSIGHCLACVHVIHCSVYPLKYRSGIYDTLLAHIVHPLLHYTLLSISHLIAMSCFSTNPSEVAPAGIAQYSG